MSVATIERVVPHLRSAGVRVRFVEGWRTRGRPGTFDPRAFFLHHTASASNAGNAPALGIVTNGRSDLPGPLANFLGARDGTLYVVASGRCNHAGEGGPLKGIPKDSGNSYAWSVEIENNGIGEPYGKKLLTAVRLLVALVLKTMKRTAYWAIGHKEWTNRKIDPSFDMKAFRKAVRKLLRPKKPTKRPRWTTNG